MRFSFILFFIALFITPLPSFASPQPTSLKPQRTLPSFAPKKITSRWPRLARRRPTHFSYQLKQFERRRRPAHFWWSVEVGNFTYMYFVPPSQKPYLYDYLYNGFLVGGRWGFFNKRNRLSLDVNYILGENFGFQVGVTYALVFSALFSLELGTGVTLLFNNQFQNTDVATNVPLEVGLSFSLPIYKFLFGFRWVNAISFSLKDGVGTIYAFRFNLFLSS